MVAGLCRLRPPLLSLFLFIVPFVPALHAAADINETSEQLSQLKEQIDAIQSRLDASEVERDSLQKDLRDIDLQIGASDIKAEKLNRERRALEERVQALEAESRSLRADQEAREQLIQQSIQHMWAMQQGGELRVWLGDQRPQDAARHITYLQILVEDQRALINEYQRGLEKIERNVLSLAEAQNQLAVQIAAQGSLKQELAEQRNTRRQTLLAINAQVSNDEQQLSKLRLDQQRLNQLFEELASVMPEPTLAPAVQPFAALRGTLSMPVSGVPSNQFGTRRNADIRWQGWLIPAAEGEPIRAVHAGRVIYADWLRGQGLLIVIDHNDGWLTLYAQNHSLMRQVGDRVTAGDVIARAGASGGRDVTGLYFEIRQQGQPVDPAQWIRR